MTCMTCRKRRIGRLLLVLGALACATGCWPEESPELPPFNCDEIDRAAERFPDECGDAGIDADAAISSDDGGADAAP